MGLTMFVQMAERMIREQYWRLFVLEGPGPAVCLARDQLGGRTRNQNQGHIPTISGVSMMSCLSEHSQTH